MAFKSVETYNEERYGSFFLLRNDGDSANVIFLYQNINDMLVADTHYIKSDEYSGYVHCCGKGCPACQKGIRTQTKLFIPLYNVDTEQIEFFDRSMRFEPVMERDVFKNYPNPSELVWKITRHGEAGSVDTYYEIKAIGKNGIGTYHELLAKFNAVMPDYYSKVCREYTAQELESLLTDSSSAIGYTSASSYSDLPQFQASPRVDTGASMPDVSQVVSATVDSGDSEEVPFLIDDSEVKF